VVRHFKAGRTVTAWRGPYQGVGPVQGETWQSYIPTPAFPEYTSGHSTFSGAAAAVLKDFRGGAELGASAAIQAGRSRRYGGIHWQFGDVQARDNGKKMGEAAFAHAKKLWEGG